MAQSFFIWNGIDCRAKGIVMRGPAAIIRPEERVNHVEIPGRSGDLTETEGKNIFNSYIQTVSISVRGGSYRVREIYKWLRGSGYVTFSGEPDRRQQARVIGAITLNKHSRNLDYWEGECQFYCQPLKELLQGRRIIVQEYSSSAKYAVGDYCTHSGSLYRCTTAITSGEAWNSSHWASATGVPALNTGDVDALPYCDVKASATTVKLKVTTADGRENEITLTGATSGTKYRIDSSTMMVTNLQQTTNHTQISSGDFPILGQGANTISGSGWSEIDMRMRERFL